MRKDNERLVNNRSYAVEQMQEAIRISEQGCKCISTEISRPLLKAIDALGLGYHDQGKIIRHGPTRSELIKGLHNKGFTQHQIARKIGFSQSMVNRILRRTVI
jgi:DNA-binding NarL/FixJ family response regulator